MRVSESGEFSSAASPWKISVYSVGQKSVELPDVTTNSLEELEEREAEMKESQKPTSTEEEDKRKALNALRGS